ncbi:MAG: cysteine desulfurase [Oscillospiraceae bacterium]|nr:cysteine desulfurase [Oscillospiraceae bacterium]
MIYLDHAATTPVPRAVADAVADALVNGYGNPSSQYPLGESAKKKLESDRATIADALGCKADELIFTSCGTESDNFAISIALRQNRRVGKHIITTAVEHSAVLEPCKRLVQEGYEVTFLKPDRNGNITIEQLAEALREDTALVSMMLVNNETGCIFPVAEAAKLLRERKSQALLHTDAVQAFLKVPFAAATLGADMISLSAHKLGAPKGIGALYLGPRVNKNAVRSLLAGGGQEGGLRSGTEATAQIAGFAKAVELRRENFEEKLAHMAAIKAYAEEKLLAIDGVERVGNGQAPHVLCLSLVGYPSANVVTELGAQGICISAGSACHRGKVSHVYAAMELAKKTAAGVLRISFAPDTTFEEIDALAAALKAHKETRFPML